MIEKQSLFRGHDDQSVFCFPLFTGISKTASVSDIIHQNAASDQIRSYIDKHITPGDKEKYLYVLVNALGAGEYFGSNINADYFPWDALTHPGDDYGYQTFLNAGVYQHHVNKDKNKSIGTVVVSSLNPQMKRVELLIKIDREKARLEGAASLLERIDNGELPDVSMGCNVPYDVCSICGHKSKTRATYCEHMNPSTEMRGTYGPNKILPDGRKIYVINTIPKFFDISFVFIGADKTAKVMAKIASRSVIQKTAQNSIYLNSLGSRSGLNIWVVNGPEVRRTLYPDFTMGGNPSRYPFIPEGEIWIDSSLSADEIKYTIDHEILEHAEMSRGKSYSKAHDDALSLESRERAQDVDVASQKRPHPFSGPPQREKVSSRLGISKNSSKNKLGEIIKEIPSQGDSVQKISPLERFEGDLPNSILDRLASFPFGSVLGASGASGIVLKPREFQRIVIMRMGDRDLADDLDSRGCVFCQSPSFDNGIDLDPEGPGVSDVLDLLRPFLAQRSAYGNPIRIRMIISRTSNNSLPTPFPVKDSLLDKIGAAYSGYRRKLLKKLAKASTAVMSDPQLRNAIIGDGVADIFSKTASVPMIGPDSISYLAGAYLADRNLLSSTVREMVRDGTLTEGNVSAQGL